MHLSELTLITLSAILRSLDETRDNRLKFTYDWIIKLFLKRSSINVDPYHFVANYWFFTSAGTILFTLNNFSQIISWAWYTWIPFVILVWFWHGLINDIFYHVILPKKEFRDPWNIWIILILKKILLID